MTRVGALYWYHFDGFGSTGALTDTSETVTDSCRYDGFGNVSYSTGTTTNAFGFGGNSGYYRDDETGLFLRGGAWYDPAVGSFALQIIIDGGYDVRGCGVSGSYAGGSGSFGFAVVHIYETCQICLYVYAGPGCSTSSLSGCVQATRGIGVGVHCPGDYTGQFVGGEGQIPVGPVAVCGGYHTDEEDVHEIEGGVAFPPSPSINVGIRRYKLLGCVSYAGSGPTPPPAAAPPYSPGAYDPVQQWRDECFGPLLP